VDVAVLADRFRAVLEDTGLLLVHDKELPSATALAAGAPFGGSWWAHPLAHPIYDALQLIEDDATRAKLVKGKVTLIAPRLWPALVAVGSGRRPWQLDGLPAAAIDLLAAVDAAGAPMRTPKGATKAVGVLERKLLVQTDEVHTESGRHAKVMQPWQAWAAQLELAPEALAPEVAAARFEAAAASWPPITGRLFAWSP